MLPSDVAPQAAPPTPLKPPIFGQAFGGHELITGIADVEARFPKAWTQFGVPVFRRLGAEHLLHRHPAIDVYRMFPQVQPDPRTTQRVDEWVAGLGSAEFSERQASQQALAGMGRPAVLALMRVDPSTLSPEQSERRRKLLSDDDWQPIAEEYAAARMISRCCWIVSMTMTPPFELRQSSPSKHGSVASSILTSISIQARAV